MIRTTQMWKGRQHITLIIQPIHQVHPNGLGFLSSSRQTKTSSNQPTDFFRLVVAVLTRRLIDKTTTSTLEQLTLRPTESSNWSCVTSR